jgi:hypothetical protein
MLCLVFDTHDSCLDITSIINVAALRVEDVELTSSVEVEVEF